MDERTNLVRGAAILCCHCLRNIAYHRSAMRRRGLPFNQTNQFLTTVHGNFTEVVILEWCKLFGDQGVELHHWDNLIKDAAEKRAFKRDLWIALGCDRKAWNTLQKEMLTYRNQFGAHLDRERRGWIPTFDLVRGSAAFYYTYLLTNERGRLPDARVDIEAYYRECHAEGREFYEKLYPAQGQC